MASQGKYLELRGNYGARSMRCQSPIALPGVCAALLTVTLPLPSQPVYGQDVVSPTEPDVIWRNDGPLLPPNTFGKYRNAFSHDGRLIGIVHQPSETWLLNASDGSRVLDMPDLTATPGAYSIAFLSTGDIVIGRSQHVEILANANGRTVQLIPCPECIVIGSVSVSPDGSMLALQNTITPVVARQAGTIIVEPATGQEIKSLDSISSRPKVSFSPDSRFLLTSANSRSSRGTSLGFRVWDTTDWSVTLDFEGESGTDLGEMATGATADRPFIAVYGRDGTIEMRDLTTGEIVWSVPLIDPIFAPRGSTVLGTELDRAEIAPNGKFLITYESPTAYDPVGHVSGGIVVRDVNDGSVMAIYEVYSVTGLSISPDSNTFVYSTGAGQVHTALARSPLN